MLCNALKDALIPGIFIQKAWEGWILIIKV